MTAWDETLRFACSFLEVAGILGLLYSLYLFYKRTTPAHRRRTKAMAVAAAACLILGLSLRLTRRVLSGRSSDVISAQHFSTARGQALELKAPPGWRL